MSHIIKNLFLPYAKQQRHGSPAHLRSLISAFVICCLDSIIPLVSISEISRLLLVSVAEQAGLSLTWSQTLRTGSNHLGLLAVSVVESDQTDGKGDVN